MNKKLLCAAFAAVLYLTACAPQAPAAPAPSQASARESGVSAAARPAASEPEAVQVSGSGESGLFAGMLAALPKDGVLEVTDTDGTAFQVDASDDAVEKIWGLLLEQSFEPLEATDELFQGPHGTISLSFSRDRNKYLIKLYGCAEDHPAYPGRTVLDLESHGDGTGDFESYIGGLSIFQEISALAEQLRGTLKVVLDKPFVKLEAGDLKGKALTSWLQMGNRMVCAFTGEDGSQAMLFDTETGALLGTSRVAEPVLRMEASRQESGFDYQMYTATRIIYKNSRSPLEEKQYTPPIPKDATGGFDVQGDRIVWAAADGVYLKEMEEGGERLVLSGGELADLAGALAPEGELYASEPRLMNDGAQLAVPVKTGEALAGMVLVDLSGDQKTGYFDVFGREWQQLAYPDKRTFAAAGESDVTVVDAASGESRRMAFAHDGETEWFTGDYSTFVVRETEKNALFAGWLASARKAGDRSRPFLRAEGRGTFRPVGASDRHFFAYADDDEGPRYILVKLRQES